MKRVRNLAIAVLAAGALPAPVQAAVTPTPLTSNVTADISATQLACVQLQYDQLLLAMSRAINDAVGVSADLTVVKADQAAVQSANQALQTAVGAYLKPAQGVFSAADTAFEAAFVQLKSDATSNPSALSSDKAAILSSFSALSAAQVQLQANQQALAGAGATEPCGHGPDESPGGSAGGPPRHN